MYKFIYFHYAFEVDGKSDMDSRLTCSNLVKPMLMNLGIMGSIQKIEKLQILVNV